VTAVTPRHLIKALRPRQWLKNLLVYSAPLSAGVLLTPSTFLTVTVSFVLFCLAASGVYLVNDVLDRDADAQHPVKRHRPVASGAVPVGVALGLAAVLLTAAIAGAALLIGWRFTVVLGVYVVLQLAYCVWLKHQVVIDLAVVSSGFLLRAVAGGAAAAVHLSPWFVLVASFGSLFMVAGKRYSERRLLGEGTSTTRRTLGVYSTSYLRFVWGIAAAASIIFYALWAVSLQRDLTVLPQLSIAPFTLAILRYAVDVDLGRAGEPESVVLGDRTLQVLALAWLLLFGVSAILG